MNAKLEDLKRIELARHKLYMEGILTPNENQRIFQRMLKKFNKILSTMPISLAKDGIPIAYAIPSRNQYIVISCPYCKDQHYHGTPVGHRNSHCVINNKPADNDGYYLVDLTA
jgi:hypothetical protein